MIYAPEPKPFKFLLGFSLAMIVAAVIFIMLAGCASAGQVAEPVVQTVKVEVPVAVKCSADPGPASPFADTPDAIKAAADIFERVKLLLAGRDQRDARLAVVTAANQGCR